MSLCLSIKVTKIKTSIEFKFECNIYLNIKLYICIYPQLTLVRNK